MAHVYNEIQLNNTDSNTCPNMDEFPKRSKKLHTKGYPLPINSFLVVVTRDIYQGQ